jgi:hypothetical protein
MKICEERQAVIDTLDKACVERLHAINALNAALISKKKSLRSRLGRFWKK